MLCFPFNPQTRMYEALKFLVLFYDNVSPHPWQFCIAHQIKSIGHTSKEKKPTVARKGGLYCPKNNYKQMYKYQMYKEHRKNVSILSMLPLELSLEACN